MEVPKNIFQTWKTSIIPGKWHEAQTSVIKKNPKWRYILLTDEDNLNIVSKYFPDFLPYYKSFKHNIQRADAIRYIVMYLYGGIYLDLDYICLKSFDLLTFNYGSNYEVGLIPSNNTQSIFTNSFIISKPKSVFWLKCIDEMKKPSLWRYVSKHMEVFNTTGPFMINRVANRYKHLVQKLSNVSIPCNICYLESCKIVKGHEEYFIKPIEGNSWHSWDSKIMNFIYCLNLKHIIIVLMLIIIFYHFSIVRKKQ
jgi:mannosyltransferase OCH1-like enzyme